MSKLSDRDKRNGYIHICYIKKDFVECLKVIDEQLRLSNGKSEYPLYIKGNLTFFLQIHRVYLSSLSLLFHAVYSANLKTSRSYRGVIDLISSSISS